MQKELNPELFGESSVMKSRVVESPSSSVGAQQMLQFDHRMAELRNQVNSVVDQMNRMVGQVNEFMKVSQQKFGMMEKQLAKLEATDQALSLDNSQKLAVLGRQLGDRKTLDGKVQEMIDRHNSVLKSYELRLSQLQKLIAEREQQIVMATASLNEAKLEIAKMKRL